MADLMSWSTMLDTPPYPQLRIIPTGEKSTPGFTTPTVTSVALMMQHCLPLLRESAGKIINISSARSSTSLASGKVLPPTVSIPYSVSKAALNLLTVEMSRQSANENVEFQLVSPGHCKTAFNGYRGTRDPLEGANVVVGLVTAEKGTFKNSGFWETKGGSMDLVEIPW